MGIAQRTVMANFECSKQRYSPRKLIPVNPKTIGDYLLLKRIKGNLSQPELAIKAGVSIRTVSAWEHDRIVPTTNQWRVLATVLKLNLEDLKVQNPSPESCDGFYTVKIHLIKDFGLSFPSSRSP
jgi:transcriptional regulator with XRE-family HTH domain